MPSTTKDLSGSTAYSAQRFAHPFYLPKPHGERTPIHGARRMTDWSKTKLGPLPPVAGDSTLDLASVLGSAGVTEIQQAGEIRFHSLGDTGVNNAQEAETVSDEMATDYHPSAGAMNPAFLFHLGDVIYGPGKQDHYVERFYRPYRHYPGKILAIPGNHDGEVIAQADSPSLSAFEANFVDPNPKVPPGPAGVGIYRETMNQPGVYWMLDAPFVRIIGLYSNRLENPGYLQALDASGKEDDSQLQWLGKTLGAIAKSKDKKALILATHHPPYSEGSHSGSTEMSASIDQLCATAKVTPDAFLSGHSHNYQRYTRRLNGKQIPYIVAGTGGIAPQVVADATGQPIDAAHNVTFDKSLKSYGYLFLTVSAHQLKIEFWQVPAPGNQAFDSVTVDLPTGQLT